jgi:carboxymethylenebutenolidase
MMAHSKDVQVTPGGGGSFSAYLAVPEAPNGSVLVVLQEIFGVNANIRGIVDGFAADGYVAIAPDLFWRQEPGVQLDPSRDADRDKAMQLNSRLDQNQAVVDATAAIDVARSCTSSTATGLAVGYCLGGKLAYLMAARGKVKAAVSYYGVGIQGALDEAANIAGRVLLHIAEKDALCPPEAQGKIAAALAQLGSRAVVVTHHGVGHAFARGSGVNFNAEATARANALTKDFLQGAATG